MKMHLKVWTHACNVIFSEKESTSHRNKLLVQKQSTNLRFSWSYEIRFPSNVVAVLTFHTCSLPPYGKVQPLNSYLYPQILQIQAIIA